MYSFTSHGTMKNGLGLNLAASANLVSSGFDHGNVKAQQRNGKRLSKSPLEFILCVLNTGRND